MNRQRLIDSITMLNDHPAINSRMSEISFHNSFRVVFNTHVYDLTRKSWETENSPYLIEDDSIGDYVENKRSMRKFEFTAEDDDD